MKNERLIRAIGEIDDDLIFNAVNDVKAGKKGRWLKWGAAAACLCLIAAAAYTVNLYVSIPENDQYMDAGIEDDTVDGNPNGYDVVWTEQAPDGTEIGEQSSNDEEIGGQGSDNAEIGEQDNEEQIHSGQAGIFRTGTPDDETFDPSNMVTMISSYGNTGSSASYKTPDNGSCLYSIPLQGAMEEYGDSVLYRVVVDVFSDNQMLEANSEAVKYEMERLVELEYTVAFKRYHDGTMNYYYFTLHATQEQLADFVINNEYGYMFWLYDERVQPF